MLFRLLKSLLRKQDWQQMEEHFSRQARAAEAEVMATRESLRTATRNALQALDPTIHQRFQRHLRRTDNPALAEMETIRDVQTLSLKRTLSVLEFGNDDNL